MCGTRLQLGLALFAAGVTVAVLACDDDSVSPINTVFAEAPFSFRLAAENRTRVAIQGINGTIEVVGDAQIDSLTVAGERRVGSSSIEDAESHLDSLEVLLTDSGDAYLIETRQPTPSDGRQYVVNYELTVPDTMQLTIANANGPIDITGIHGTVSVSTANGNIVVTDIEGSATARSANGAITARIVLPTDGSIDLATANGRIILRIPATTSATLYASLVLGTIRVSGLVVQDEESTSTSLRGTLGAGEGAITLLAANGDITIQGF